MSDNKEYDCLDRKQDLDEFPIECDICDSEITHIHNRHNAEPVKDGFCCSLCNMEYVIPKRMGMVVIAI